MVKVKKDSLGDRMKAYEACTQTSIPRRTYSVIRLDGRAFHSYVKKIKASKPFDETLMSHMDATAKYLCENIQGAAFAYVQSDEISILITDFDKVDTQAWFGGNVQKQVSIAASMATAYFNAYRPWVDSPHDALFPKALAMFDARVFIIPDPVEVYNCFLWRVRDWERNSIQMLSRSQYSHKELQGKKVSDMHELLHKKEKNWAKLPDHIKRGRLITRLFDPKKPEDKGAWSIIPMFKLPEEKAKFQSLIPTPGYE